MPRKRSDSDTPKRPAKVYAYKSKPPAPESARYAIDQMFLANRYQNALVRVERDRRDATDALAREIFPDVLRLTELVAGLEAGKEAAEQAIKKRRRDARSRLAATDDERAALRSARANLKRARTDLKAARSAAFADPAFRARSEGVEAVSRAAGLAARAEFSKSGLYWGTYLLVEDACRDIRRGAPPRFRRFDGRGVVSAQIQHGMTWGEALAGKDNRLRVVVLPAGPGADPDSVRSRTCPAAEVWVRAGSDAGKKPVWVVARVRLHREPPPGSLIKRVRLHRDVVGRHAVWSVQFVIENDAWAPGDADAETDYSPAGPHGVAPGVVGVDVNWRLTPDGLRVAYAVGGDGREETLVLPRAWLGEWEKVESLQSIRDRNFNEARETLARWLDDNPIPEWLAERTRHLRAWKSIDRLSAVVFRWSSHRFNGDDAIFAAMAAWRKQEAHLHNWQDAQARKVVARRNDLYRKFAAGLRRRYGTVRVEKTDWKKLRAVPTPDEDDVKKAARVYARIAAPGLLTETLTCKFDRALSVPPKDTTRACHLCGRVDEFDQAAELVHECSGCGKTWDQDYNAAVWLLRGGVAAGIPG